MKVLITDVIHSSFTDWCQEKGFQISHQAIHEAHELEKYVADVEILVIRSKTVVNEQVIRKAKKLKYLARIGSGMENVEISALEAVGIQWCNSPEGNRDAVAEHCLGMILSLLNKFPSAQKEFPQLVWRREESRGEELGHLTLGIYGFGNAGSALADRLACFGTRILAYDKFKSGFGGKNVQECTEETLLQEADILSFHIPLNQDTKHLINRELFERISKPIYLINTSRGAIARTEDLLWALQNNRLKGLAMDVFEEEPPLSGSLGPLIQKIQSFPNVIMTPHVAGWSAQSEEKMARVLIRKLSDFFIGEN